MSEPTAWLIYCARTITKQADHTSRGVVEDTRLEAKAKDTKKFEAKAKDRPSRGQGQGQTLSRPRPRTKDTDASVLKKKKVFKIFFRRA